MSAHPPKNLKISVVGGGPGGLYFSILTKKALPYCEIDVYERNKPDDSFGFGVVFSDETLAAFLKRDPLSYDRIRENFAYWDDLIIARDGEEIKISGNGFCGCSRKTLLQLLHQRCAEEGIRLHFETEIDHKTIQQNADIVIAADGIGSGIRTQFENEFKTKMLHRTNRFVWLGSTKPLDAFTYFFKTTPQGIIVAHSYQYEPNRSTWIFECSDETFSNLGLDVYDEKETIQKMESLFAVELDGHALIGNKSHWRQFPHITNEKWSHQNIVLLGDAKATAHFSIGSGTKLAMESAIALSDAVVANPDNVQNAFAQYEQKRRPEVEKIQKAALISMQWFERMDHFGQEPFYRLAFGCMTRSHRVTFENLSIRDNTYTDWTKHEFARFHHFKSAVIPIYTPWQIQQLGLENRWVMHNQKVTASLPIELWEAHYLTPCLGGIGLQIFAPTLLDSQIESQQKTLDALTQITKKIHEFTSTKVGWQVKISDENLLQPELILGKFKDICADVLVLSLSRMSLRGFDADEWRNRLKRWSMEAPTLIHLEMPSRHISVKERDTFIENCHELASLPLSFWFELHEDDQNANDAEIEDGFFNFLQEFRKKHQGSLLISGLRESVDLANTQILNHHTDAVAWEKTFVYAPFEALKTAAEEGIQPQKMSEAAQFFWKSFSKEAFVEKQKWVGMKKALKPKSNKK